ncbi:hypothetical protein [Streptomyces sp. NPDC005322]|uniref:hypothetical protein n=1 Tax=Streptomyces sp. NPDC005322 TaxID=3157032 RepID=UPI0033BA2CEF
MDWDDENLAATAPVVAGASAFIEAIWVQHSLATAWPHVDPLLRTCWAQSWLTPLLPQAQQDGYHPDEVVDQLTLDEPAHSLWEPFARTQVDALCGSFKVSPQTWGFASDRRLIAPDIELLRYLPVPATGAIQADEQYAYMPFLMRYSAPFGWRVLNFVSEHFPQTGWPPKLA